MRTEFDVVVVGAGVNGLAVGCYLQRAGLDVAIVEKRNECGPFAMTEDIFRAGVPVDTHAGVCFLTMSPVWADLDLDSFGLDLIIPEIPAGTIWKDGRNLLYSYDPSRTYAAFARHSERDAATFMRLLAGVSTRSVEILDRVVFAAPSEENLDYIWSLGELVGFSARDFRSMNGVEMLDLLYENDCVKMSLLGGTAINVFGDVGEKGEGALMALLGMTVTLGVPRGGMHGLVHSLVRCFRRHGGTLILNAPAERVTFAAGLPRGVALSRDAPYPEAEIRARHAIDLHVSPPLALAMIGADRVKSLDHGLWRKMTDWDMTGHCAFTSYALLDGVPHWTSASWNPDVLRCAFPLRSWDSWEQAKASFQVVKNEELFGMAAQVGEMYNLGAVDSSRLGPRGETVVVFEVEYPVNLRRYGGMQAWEDRALTDRLHAAHMADLRAMIDDFDRRCLASTYTTPIDNWRRNPSAVYGHELGGDCSGAQWYLGRMPSRSTIAGLYFSQGVWPASLTHLGNGYVTACAIAEDLGVRARPWWQNEPGRRFMERLGQRGP